jgi:hypothetical protein
VDGTGSAGSGVESEALGVEDSVIQRTLRHSTVATMQNHYIKTASPDAIPGKWSSYPKS